MKNKSFFNYINQVKFNVVFSILVLVFSWVIGISSYVHPSANHGAMFPYILPPFFFISTIVLYFISRIFVKKYNWIISIIGAIINLYFAIEWYLTNNI